MEGVWAASRISFHVQPSLRAADFFGIPEKAFLTAFNGVWLGNAFTLGT